MSASPAPHTSTLHPPTAGLPGIGSAQVVVPCTDLAATLAWFTEQLGFRVELISPADDPALVVISGLGVRLRLVRVASTGSDAGATTGVTAPALVLTCDDPAAVLGGADHLVAPNGSRIDVVSAHPEIEIPDLVPSLVISRLGDAPAFHTGRAGMGYRDLIPDRLGGRFIASHIRIAGEGPVPDYVHFHQVRFQMIYCYRGWVEVVYEDQGVPFVMHAGDCVLQPPTIRHRVLSSGAGLEVIELGCPAIHDTHADPTTSLPTGLMRPERDFGGQRFVRHVAAEAVWQPARFDGFEHRDIGIATVTDGLAGVRVLRPTSATSTPAGAHDAEFVFMFVLDGAISLDVESQPVRPLAHGDSVVVPAGVVHRWLDASPDLELLEVTLPAVVTHIDLVSVR